MAIIVKEELYHNFGKCVYIANEKQEMRVTLDVGPRIISYNLVGKKDMMFCDTERLFESNDEPYKNFFGKDKSWYIYGGHRFWIAPEDYPATYYPDNNPISYTQNENVFTFTQPIQKETGWQIVMEITFHESEAKATVRHILTNTTDKEKRGAIWTLSATAQGGRVFQRMANEDTGLLPNRYFIIWPYDSINDYRLYVDDEYIAVQQDPQAQRRFKIGINNTHGTIFCLNNGTVFKKEFPYFPGKVYADNGCSTEVFTDCNILEMETLSPIYTLKPGESCEHAEKWSLTPEDSVNLEDVVKYL